jgi:predicted transcriptional regulator
MTTTTIRVDQDTHRRLVEISRSSSRPLIDVVRDAVDALERTRFATLVAAQLDAIRHQPEVWASYTADADLGLGDGIA